MFPTIKFISNLPSLSETFSDCQAGNVRWVMSRSLEHQVLTRAIRYMEKGWTTRTLARDKDGQHCWTWQVEAVQFCALGALYRAAHDLTKKDWASVAEMVAANLAGDHLKLSKMGDASSKEAMVSLFQERLKMIA